MSIGAEQRLAVAELTFLERIKVGAILLWQHTTTSYNCQGGNGPTNTLTHDYCAFFQQQNKMIASGCPDKAFVISCVLRTSQYHMSDKSQIDTLSLGYRVTDFTRQTQILIHQHCDSQRHYYNICYNYNRLRRGYRYGRSEQTTQNHEENTNKQSYLTGQYVLPRRT